VIFDMFVYNKIIRTHVVLCEIFIYKGISLISKLLKII